MLSLTALEESLPHQTEALHIAFVAVGSSTHHNGELHLGKARYPPRKSQTSQCRRPSTPRRGDLPHGMRRFL